MKNFLVLLLVSLLLFAGCIRDEKIEVGDNYWEIFEQYEYTFRHNNVNVFKVDDEYIAVITYNDIIIKKAHFTSDRIGYKAVGLSLIENVDANKYIGWSMEEIEEEFGKIHADIETGFYVPSYITEDGYLLSFILDSTQEIICGYTKKDIINTGSPEEVVLAEDYLN